MPHISKSQIKLIRSLQQKKFRDQLGLFVAEGDKCINELRKAFELVLLVNNDNATPTEIQQMSALRTPQGSIAVFKQRTEDRLSSAGGAMTACSDNCAERDNGLTAITCNNHREANIVQQPSRSNHREPSSLIHRFTDSPVHQSIILCLDGIQDPGNLGTIIRTADWFGVHHIVCSPDTADCYTPKVVQATMGSLARVHIHYTPLPQWLSSAGGAMTACNDNCAERDNGLTAITCNNHREATIVQQSSCIVHCQPSAPIFGTLLDGQNMYEVLQQITGDRCQGTEPCIVHCQPSIIIMGNEGNGISKEVREYITHPIRIPSYPSEAETSESLNVAIATAIVLAEFRRLEAK